MWWVVERGCWLSERGRGPGEESPEEEVKVPLVYPERV